MWICVTGSPIAPGDIPIKLSNGTEVVARSADWRAVTAGGVLTPAESRTFAQVVHFSNLPARTHFAAKANEAEAGFVTLPAALPRVGDRPFTVLLGSCYFGDRDRGLSTTMQALSHEVKIDMKLMSGDQVYLDFPSFVFGVPFSEKGKASLFLAKYLRNWSESGRYRSVLQEGATYFTADDHEFWNNYPNPATIISPTWSQGGRDEFRRTARPLFDAFQTDPAQGVQICRRVNVGNLSFMIADTRLEREEGDTAFMSRDHLDEVVGWLGESGAGVLVVGQPIFADPQTGFLGGLTKRFADRNLPDYEQYRTLSNALLRANRSVLILTGDVHYPRVAEAVRLGETGREIIEVIASPAALVAGSHSSTKDVPARFPAKPGAGKSLPLTTVKASRRAGDNLAVLEFTETPGRINVQLKYWFVGPTPAPGPIINFSLTT